MNGMVTFDLLKLWSYSNTFLIVAGAVEEQISYPWIPFIAIHCERFFIMSYWVKPTCALLTNIICWFTTLSIPAEWHTLSWTLNLLVACVEEVYASIFCMSKMHWNWRKWHSINIRGNKNQRTFKEIFILEILISYF